MNFLQLIEQKRDGQALAAEQIQSFIAEYVSGRIPDYQMASMLMAIFFRGMTTAETSALTLAMHDSGDVLKFPKDSRPLVDKHSTGGVGDKVSLPLAPLLACLGFRVPMISGRGLGITGGTLDKLESIPGFQTMLPAEKIIEQVQTVGCVICGQTDKMVPADKKLYALRDVTGTVPSIPLIVASIMSKKLAESLDALILDVKFGSAAFMQTKEQARELAQAMVALGNECGVNTRALLTNMHSPLGRAAGNWLEVKESVECLQSHRPRDLEQLTIECAAHILLQLGLVKVGSGNEEQPMKIFPPSGMDQKTIEKVVTLIKAERDAQKPLEEVRELVGLSLDSRAPREKFDEMLAAQGADLDAFNRKLALDHTAPVVKELKARSTRIVKSCDARIVGEIVRDLGGGRLTKESKINHDVGIDQLAKPGEMVESGKVIARVHAASTTDAETALARLETAFSFCDEPPWTEALVQEVIS